MTQPALKEEIAALRRDYEALLELERSEDKKRADACRRILTADGDLFQQAIQDELKSKDKIAEIQAQQEKVLVRLQKILRQQT